MAQGNPRSAIIGTGEKGLKDPVVETPGPGQHEPALGASRSKARAAVIPKEQNRHGYINKDSARNPGPGAYASPRDSAGGGSSRRGGAGGFPTDKRETEFDKIKKRGEELPGAGSYEPANVNRAQGSSFAHGARPEPGAKGEQQPGPGAYGSGAEESKRRPQTGKPTIGSTKRPDLWNTKNASAQGPGSYQQQKGAFEESKGATISKDSRFRPVSGTTAGVTPGPGAYRGEAGRAKPPTGAARMGTSRRTDNFVSKEEADLPGPGNYGEQYSSFSKTQNVPLGGKYKSKLSDTPGPGQYGAVGSRNAKGAKMGTQPRKDPFEAARRNASNQPGPGNYVENTNTFGGKGQTASFGGKHKQV